MSDSDAAEVDALQRLEAALDRIAQRTHEAPVSAGPRVDTVSIATRLDRLIGQLRDALSDDNSALEA